MADRYSIDQDLREAKAMTESLTRYVQGDQLYGTVGGGGFFSGGRMPSMTVGALIMRLRRLRALQDTMTEEQRQQFAEIEQQHEAVRKEWRYHYEQKMIWEANSRLDAMKTFFEECSSDPKLCARVYGPEVLRRTTVEEILIAMKELNIEDEELTKKARGTDSRLRRFTQPSSFVWAKEMQPAYPQSEFWWMYSRPPENQ
jgi:hypothetical protein